jgi:hypothetical protein
MAKINWNTFRPGDVVSFYFNSTFRETICFQFKTWDDYYVYGKLGEKWPRYILTQSVEVGVIR